MDYYPRRIFREEISTRSIGRKISVILGLFPKIPGPAVGVAHVTKYGKKIQGHGGISGREMLFP